MATKQNSGGDRAAANAEYARLIETLTADLREKGKLPEPLRMADKKGKKGPEPTGFVASLLGGFFDFKPPKELTESMGRVEKSNADHAVILMALEDEHLRDTARRALELRVQLNDGPGTSTKPRS
jgi:hypothetical protein